MGVATRLLACVCAVSVQVGSVITSECQLPLDANGEFVVSTQADLNGLGSNCTVLLGSITIANNYTGSLVLDGITNITGSLSPEFNTSSLQSPIPNLTSISMSDLLYLGSLNIDGLTLPNGPALTNVSFPKAKWMGDIYIQNLGGTYLNFSSLVSVGAIQLSGRILDLDFSSLVEVDNIITITSDPDLPLQLRFPSLENGSVISLSGNFESLSMPLLAIARCTVLGNANLDLSRSYGLYIQASGSPLYINLPSLSQVNNTYFRGSLLGISLPSLLDTLGDFEVFTTLPLSVNLTSLQKVNQILLNGNITGAEFPAAESITNIIITSESPMNCTPAETAFDLHHAANAYGPFSCITPAISAKNGLSVNAKIGISLGIILPVTAALSLFGTWWVRKKIEKEKAEMREMDRTVPAGGDEPPAYSSVDGTAMGSIRSLRSEETVVQQTQSIENLDRTERIS